LPGRGAPGRGAGAAGFAGPGVGAAGAASACAAAGAADAGASSRAGAGSAAGFAAAAGAAVSAAGALGLAARLAPVAAGLASVSVFLPAPAASRAARSRRATGGSMVDEGLLTYSPSSFSFSRATLLSTPSSEAISCTRGFATVLLSGVRPGTGADHQ